MKRISLAAVPLQIEYLTTWRRGTKPCGQDGYLNQAKVDFGI